MRFKDLVVFRGGGELASGAIRRLFLAGFPVVVLENEKPTCVRRTVSFANCVYEGEWEVEGVKGKLVESEESMESKGSRSFVTVMVDPEGKSLKKLRPKILIDGRMAKRNLGTHRKQADVVIAMGPGFVAPADAHFVIETARGHDLGRVITRGSAQENTHIPGEIGGATQDRVLRAEGEGIFQAKLEIGKIVKKGDIVGQVNGKVVKAKIDGVVRGLLRNGIEVHKGQKIGDIDPRGDVSYNHRVSDKANAVAGGILEAVFRELQGRE